MRTIMIIGVLVAALGALPARVHASQFTVVAQVSPLSVPNGGTATLTVHTRIGADCVTSVLYDDGSAAPNLPGQHVGQSGIIQWKWQVNTGASVGTAASACVSKGQQQVSQVQFAVSPKQPTIKGKVILTWSGQSAKKSTDILDSPTFTIRGPFIVTARFIPMDSTKVATADAPAVANDVKSAYDNFPDIIAIDVAKPPVDAQIRVTDNPCQFGCHLFVNDPNNVHWTLTVTQ